ncbi:hypothetical protein JXB27_02015 [Candidatus Woesearchaeota archaeon]|nr:hypothetical protein [Candidatus Woesearchaeota archaeon]
MKKSKSLTDWAFLIGAVVSILVGIGAALQAGYASNKWIPVILVVLGLIVGLVNVTAKEVVGFLVAAIALLAFGSGGLSTLDTLIPKLGTLLGSSVQAFSFFVGAAAVVVALKAVWGVESKK